MKNLLPLLITLISISAYSQSRVEYQISFENAIHHEAEVTFKITDLKEDTLKLFISRSSPGRYALHEFAKNIYNVKAFNGNGSEIKISRSTPYQWNITDHDGTVGVTYTIFSDHPDGTYSGIDISHAHLNMPATFIYPKGFEEFPIFITFNVPWDSDWKIATQLLRTEQEKVYMASNLKYFMDSPVELSAFTLEEWEVISKGNKHKIRLALHHNGTEEEAIVYSKMAKEVINEEIEVFGELPQFDFNEYIFIADYLPYVNEDGMEHRNSSILTSPHSLDTGSVKTIGTLAHEFFHCWNVERLRPKSLVPFNFDDVNMSGELWFAEGFTEYYENLILARTEIFNLDRFLEQASKNLDAVINTNGKNYFSAVEMSQRAAYYDGASSEVTGNKINTFVSYYDFGAAIALGLDLTLRENYAGLTLDAVMKRAWEKYGRKEIPYTNEDLESVLAEVTGNSEFAHQFFQKYIYGKEILDYESLLSKAGLLLFKSEKNKASLGKLELQFENEKAIIKESPEINSPLYNAGLDAGDCIIRIGSIEIKNSSDIEKILNTLKPDQTVLLEYIQHGKALIDDITLEENKKVNIIPYENASLELTEQMRYFRNKWLERKVSNKISELKKYCPVCGRNYQFKYEHCQFDGARLTITPNKNNSEE